jgi:hypothetical protein
MILQNLMDGFQWTLNIFSEAFSLLQNVATLNKVEHENNRIVL